MSIWVGVHKMNLIILNIVKKDFANYVVARASVLRFRYVPRENFSWKLIVAIMRTRSVNLGLSSLLHRRLMSLMHRSVCWTSNVVCGCCEHLTYTFWWLHDSSVRNAKWFRIEAPKTFLKHRRTYEMFQGLKLGFQASAHVKRYETFNNFLKPAH